MKPLILSFSPVLLLLSAAAATAGVMPQDSWGYYGKKLAEPDAIPKKCVAVSSTAVYVGVRVAAVPNGNVDKVQKYALDGSYQGLLASGLTNVVGLACEADGDVIVMDQGTLTLSAYNPAGTVLWSTGAGGGGDMPGQFGSSIANTRICSSLVSIDGNGEIYVADPGNSRVQVFDGSGAFLRSISGPGTAAGSFQTLAAVAVRDGVVYTVDSPVVNNRHRIQQFKADGTFLKSYGGTGTPGEINFIADISGCFAVTPDGLLAISSPVTPGYTLFDSSLNLLDSFPVPPGLPQGPGAASKGVVYTPSGDLWHVANNSAYFLERRHSSTDNPPVRNVVPQPKLVKVAQRPASTLLDIDYQVIDPDSATVETAALAFVNGGDTFDDVLRLTTLVEGTAANVGPGQASNVTKRLTWNAATDWSTEFGELQIEILAKDERNLLGIHWITVPASGGSQAFAASARTVGDKDLLSIWYWLIAKGDSAISLVNGEVKGVGGAYNGQVLAVGNVTTDAGRNFLYGRLGVRAATATELSSIAAGNYGFASSSEDTVVRP